jgi:arsenate reductase
MREVGIDLSSATPQYLATELTKDAHIVITMGCGDDCPLIPGVERDEWPVDDPQGQPPEAVRRIRDEIRSKVVELVKERKWE